MLCLKYFQRVQKPVIAVTNANLVVTSRNYAYKPGNRFIESFNKNADLPRRWKKHWFLAMQRKAKIEGPEKPVPRSSLPNWNLKAELTAFKLRLQVDVSDEDLLKVFSVPEHDDSENIHNVMVRNGMDFTSSFVQHYVEQAYPMLPVEGQRAIHSFLLEITWLSNIAKNMGFIDFIQCVPFPPKHNTLSNCLFGFIDAICKGPGGEVAGGRYILDFIIPNLVGKDILHDIWKLENPMNLLSAELKKQGKQDPEARLVRQSGVDTVMPVFFVALFSGEEFLCESCGESIILAETDAAKVALKDIYNVGVCSQVRPFGTSVDAQFLEKLFSPLTSHSARILNKH